MFVKPLTQASQVQSTFTEIVKVGTTGSEDSVFPRQRGPRGQAAEMRVIILQSQFSGLFFEVGSVALVS